MCTFACRRILCPACVLLLLFTTSGCESASDSGFSQAGQAGNTRFGAGAGSNWDGFTPGPGTGTPVPFNPDDGGNPGPTPSPTPPPSPLAPTAENDAYSIETGITMRQTGVTGVLANDDAQGGIVSFPSTTAAGGTLSGQADGSFTYLPPTGFAGADSFEYTVTNNVGSSSALASLAVNPRTFRAVSITIAGVPAGGSGYNGTALNQDGSIVGFVSLSSALVAGPDTGGDHDVFLTNTLTGVTERVSNTPAGTPPNDFSGGGMDMTPDANLIVFPSDATNIVPGDTNGATDIFLVNRTSGTTEIISLDSNGAQFDTDCTFPYISADGRFVTFSRRGTPSTVMLRDRVLGTTIAISATPAGSIPNEDSFNGVLSANGRWIVMMSEASDLVQGDTNGQSDIFLHDTLDGTTRIVSRRPGGGALSNGYSSAPAIDGVGRKIVFRSDATNLVDGDTNSAGDIFVYDSVDDSLTRVSTSATEDQLDAGATEPAISDDGLYVSFSSGSSNVVAESVGVWPQVYVKDLLTGNIAWISRGPAGELGDSQSGGLEQSFFSGDSKFLTFVSASSNWIPGDSIGDPDVFEVSNPFAR